ncbi:MAG: hypothetical protein O7H41_14695 [Planctomycetota bacterium]|nr:hypothetical protein [Planctomycetota bacterium]
MSSADRSVKRVIGMAAALVLFACNSGSSSKTTGTLAPPGGVSATASPTDITVDWTQVAGATSYNVYWGTAPGVTKSTGTQVPVVSPPFVHTGLIDGTTYYYVVTSVTGATEGVESVEVNAYFGPNTGVLDPSFGGGNGWVNHDSAAGGNWVDEAYGVSIDSAGRILVTGYSMNAVGHITMVVWRLNDDGSLDTTFNSQGWVTFDGGGGNAALDEGYSVYEDSSGRIVVAGTYGVDAINQDMAIWRYMADGTPDASFGTAGLVSHDGAAGAPGGEEFAWAMIIDSSDRIVCAGSSARARGDYDMVIWRYDPTGVLDSTFASGGIFVHDGAAGGIDSDEALNVTEDPSGRLVATGYSTTALGDIDMVIWRLDSSGTLDTTFGAGTGIVTHDSAAGGNGEDYGEGIGVDASGRIIVSGISMNLDPAPNFDTALWVFDDAGSLDTTFGTGGVIVEDNTAGGNYWDDGLAIALHASGRIFMAGFSTGPRSDRDMVVWGYFPSGARDLGFAGSGIFIDDNAAGGMGDDTGHAAILDSQNRLVVAGSSVSPSSSRDMVVWRIR